MTPEEAQAHIYRILQTHDIPLAKEELSWAFAQDKTAVEVVEYTERYLGEECILGLEEAEIYEHIKTTHLLKLHKSRDLGLVYTPSDEELRVEIEMLRESTDGYKRQTEVLSRQREVLEGIRKREAGVKEAKAKLREKRKKKWQAERERLGADIENLTITLRHQLNDLMAEGKPGEAQGETMGLVDLKFIKNLLASDDKAVEKLERLAEETSVEGLDTTKEGDIVEKVRKMTVKLSSLMTTVVRHRLDRTYFEALSGEQLPDGEKQPEQDEYIAVLKADLESLDAEIPDVAKMSAEAEFLRPVVGEVQKRKGMLEEVISGRGAYIRNVLLQLQARNQHIIHFLEKDLYRYRALKKLSSQLETLAKSPLPQSRDRAAGGDRGSTPPPHDGTSASRLALARTPGGKGSTSPTKHLPAHLRRAVVQQSSAPVVPPSTPKRTAGRYTPRRRRRGRTGDEYSDDDDGDDDNDDGDGFYDGEDPEIALLLHLGVSLPPHLADVPQTPFARASTTTDTPETAKATRAHLTKQLHALRSKITQQELQLDKSIRAAIYSSISEVAAIARIIDGQVYADREFGIPASGWGAGGQVGGALAGLVPEGWVNEEGVRRKIGEVEMEVERLSKGMKRLVRGVEELKETDGAGAGYGGVQARERFVGRWGRGGV